MDAIDSDLARLHRDGESAVRSIHFIYLKHGISLYEAKERLMMHPDWATVAKEANVLHDAVEQALSEDEK